ncbi:MAG: Do family serine endopeptidase [Bacteroidales bacterium]|nr:Do family serine endopeptidase [Bacteroidales bacterium]
MKRFVLSAMALVLALTVSPCETQAATAVPQNPIDLTYAAENAVNSVVYIKVTINGKTQTIQYRDPFEDFFGDFFGRGGGGGSQRQIQTPKRTGAGSGVILTADGYIVTNNHVVQDADELTVKLNDNREFKARIIGLDKTTDLALIKIEAKDLPAITVANSDDLKLGEWVLAIGNPFSLTSTVTAGIVSAKARSLGATPGSIESFIQTDAAINPGNSGGALVNARGELVGINAMLYSQTGSYSGYGFAIPTSIMNKVVDDLRQYGTVQRALLGISGQDVSTYIDAEKEKGREPDLGTVNGIYVAEVSADGAAAAAGLKEGDVITAIDGKTIEKFGQLQELLVNHRPGDKVSVTYLRDKKKHTVQITLRNIQGTTTAVKTLDTESMGAALRPLNDQEKQQLNLPYGLMISAIREGKFKEAGLTKGLIIMKVNEKEMRTTADFEEAVKAANLSPDRVLWIRAKTQSGVNRSFAVELADEKPAKK